VSCFLYVIIKGERTAHNLGLLVEVKNMKIGYARVSTFEQKLELESQLKTRHEVKRI